MQNLAKVDQGFSKSRAIGRNRGRDRSFFDYEYDYDSDYDLRKVEG